MSIRRVVPDDAGALDATSPDARSTLLDWYRIDAAQHLRLNLVSTLDGRAAGHDGTSESLTSRNDRMILGVIRELSDGVLVGAESVRREGYRRPRRARLALLSASGDLTGHRLDEPPRRPGEADPSTAPVLVLTTPRGAARAAQTLRGVKIDLVVFEPESGAVPTMGGLAESGGSPRIPLTGVLAELRSRGWQSIACEGGPTLAGQLLESGLVDEVCLTVMPRLGGALLPLLGESSHTAVSLSARQLLIDDDGAMFGRWTVLPPR